MSGLKKKERSKLTQERVKELFDYCEDTGVLIRKIRHTGCVNIGDRVGCIDRTKFRVLAQVDGRKYSLDSLVWLWNKGYLPTNKLVFLDGDYRNTRIENLKETCCSKDENILTQEIVRELFDYDCDTGILTRTNFDPGSRNGYIAGGLGSSGYLVVCVNYKSYLVHRIIWLWMEGYLPENQIDHINRDRLDNSWSNLREISPSCNTRNSTPVINRSSGVRGVIRDNRSGIFSASLYSEGKTWRCTVGRDLTEAVAHRLAAEQCLGWEGCDCNSPAYQYMQKFIKGEL